MDAINTERQGVVIFEPRSCTLWDAVSMSSGFGLRYHRAAAHSHWSRYAVQVAYLADPTANRPQFDWHHG